ncbi:MAG TPA: hypothetical protein VFK79_10815 [Xanthobacteraceae bacterium]|nr:hypothetical protein [Xanthobacteraceae bacterium]
MLSKRNYAQLAAVAALAILFSANTTMKPANAQAGLQLAQADVKKTTTTKRVVTNGDRKRVTTRTTTSTAAGNNRSNTRVVVRSGNYNRGVVTHSYAPTSVAFVVHGPRAVYASYGSGWCRALHSGRHWAPRVGNHRGRHVGAVRCG